MLLPLLLLQSIGELLFRVFFEQPAPSCAVLHFVAAPCVVRDLLGPMAAQSYTASYAIVDDPLTTSHLPLRHRHLRCRKSLASSLGLQLV